MKYLEEGDRYLGRLSEERFYLVMLVAITSLVALVMTVFVVDLNRNFLVYAADTSVYHNVLVNLLHAHGFRDTAYSGPNLLGQHTALVLLLIAPLYALVPSVDLLFTLQVWVVSSAVIPLYLIAREIVRRPLVAFLVAVLALTNPLLFEMAAGPFHTESGILPAVLWSYYFYRRNYALGFWIAYGLAVSCAEQAGLIYATLGLIWFCADDGLAWRKRFARFALIGGLGWLIFSVGLLIPMMHQPGQFNLIHYHYAQWGVQSASELAVALVQNPLLTLHYLLNPGRWLHVVGLVGLPLFLAVLAPRFLTLLLPFPIYFLMSDHEFFLNFHAYYYQFAFLAGYLGLIDFLSRWEVSTRLGMTILVASFTTGLLVLFPKVGYYSALASNRDEDLSATLRATFDKIPPDAGVYSPVRYSAYLSNRMNIVMGDLRDENLDFEARLDAEYAYTDVHPAQIDYMVCDIVNDQCGGRLAGFDADLAKNRAANISRYVQSGQWQMFWNQNDVVILSRVGKQP